MSREISRKTFLKTLAAAGSCAVLSRLALPAKALALGQPSERNGYAILTDFTRCIGCRRCEAACNTANGLPEPEKTFDDKSVFENKRRTDEKTLTVVNRYPDPTTGRPVYVKTQCNHCAEPACASACPVGALIKSPEGPVVYDESICIGCRYCMTACPFYIPAFEYFDPGTPAIVKCQMCHERLAKGELPACATECPVEAITFGTRNELLEVAHSRIGNAPGRYIDHIYGEYEIGGTDWLYLSGVPFEQLGFPELNSKAMPEYTKEFMTGVPAVMVIWPALLSGFYLFSKARARNEAAEEESSEKGDN